MGSLVRLAICLITHVDDVAIYYSSPEHGNNRTLGPEEWFLIHYSKVSMCTIHTIAGFKSSPI
jgi:hypothetical protein